MSAPGDCGGGLAGVGAGGGLAVIDHVRDAGLVALPERGGRLGEGGWGGGEVTCGGGVDGLGYSRRRLTALAFRGVGTASTGTVTTPSASSTRGAVTTRTVTSSLMAGPAPGHSSRGAHPGNADSVTHEHAVTGPCDGTDDGDDGGGDTTAAPAMATVWPSNAIDEPKPDAATPVCWKPTSKVGTTYATTVSVHGSNQKTM